MKAIKLFAPLVLFCVMIFTGCSDTSNNPQPPETFTYPDAIGSYWEYEKRLFYTNLNPDTLNLDYETTITGRIDVLGDTIISGESYRIFNDLSYHVIPSGDTAYYYVRSFLRNTPQGMILGGMKGNFGPAPMPLRVANGGGQILYIKMPGDITPLTPMLLPPGSVNMLDTIFESPLMILRYPIATGIEWLFNSTSSFDVYRKYVKFEMISGMRMAMKTQRWLSIIPQSDALMYDYISAEGQLKRDYKYKMIVTNEIGEVLGTATANEVINVTSYYIAK